MMVRSIIILALAVSLFYLVRYLQPGVETAAPAKVATGRLERPQQGLLDGTVAGFNPVVASPLPDVNKDYIFSEKRKFEKDEPVLEAAKMAPVDPGPDLLATVQYTGAVITGDLRRALVVYQDQPAAPAPGRRPTGAGRAPAPPPAAGATQKKQLDQGDRFLGYVVAAVEPDRIVFEKGDQKVEKFLHDRNKKRPAPRVDSPPQEAAAGPMEIGGVPLQAIAPPEVLAALLSQPPAKGPAAGAVVGGTAGGGTGAKVDAKQPQSNRMVRRSQRLLGLDPTIDLPLSPVPGLPAVNQ